MEKFWIQRDKIDAVNKLREIKNSVKKNPGEMMYNKIKKIEVNTRYGLSNTEFPVIELTPVNVTSIEVKLDENVETIIEKTIDEALKEQDPSGKNLAEEILEIIAERGIVIT